MTDAGWILMLVFIYFRHCCGCALSDLRLVSECGGCMWVGFRVVAFR